MPPRRRVLTPPEESVWAEFTREVRPLRGGAAIEAPAAAVKPVDAPPPAVKPAVARVRREALLEIGASPGGIDKASWQRLRSGKLVPARTLDLHGRTAQRAFDALHAFLHSAQAEGVRCVEVITGRGVAEGTGVIRRELPHWLNQPGLRGLVLGAAYPHAANPGAVRLLLRRPR
jgi:DNA-nicking Smr family endonuclease